MCSDDGTGVGRNTRPEVGLGKQQGAEMQPGQRPYIKESTIAHQRACPRPGSRPASQPLKTFTFIAESVSRMNVPRRQKSQKRNPKNPKKILKTHTLLCNRSSDGGSLHFAFRVHDYSGVVLPPSWSVAWPLGEAKCQKKSSGNLCIYMYIYRYNGAYLEVKEDTIASAPRLALANDNGGHDCGQSEGKQRCQCSPLYRSVTEPIDGARPPQNISITHR